MEGALRDNDVVTSVDTDVVLDVSGERDGVAGESESLELNAVVRVNENEAFVRLRDQLLVTVIV